MRTPLASGERVAFAERLRNALFEAGIRPSPTLLAREYNLRSPAKTITTHAVRKWLFAEAIPTQARLQILAEIVNATPNWLRFGDGTGPAKKGKVSIPMSHDIARMFEDIQLLDDSSRELLDALVRKMLAQQHAR